MAGTLMTFSAVTFDAAKRLGVTLERADGDAWIHHWGVVGHLMGIEDALIPHDLADAELLMESIRERQWAPSQHSHQLASALVDTMQEFFTREVDVLDGLTPSLVRHLAGDRCADVLRLPPADWTQLLIASFTALTEIVDDGDRDTLLERGLGAIAGSSMRWITDVERAGKNASFRVPASLRRAVIGGT
jgi:hypothetical protein